MSAQIPLPGMDRSDKRSVFLRVMRTYPSQRIKLSQLFGCWRPGGPNHPWREARICAAIEDLEAESSIERQEAFCGTDLVVTRLGIERYSETVA